MEMKAAQQIGGRQAVRTLFFVILIVELVLLIRETSGDFANGILFYIAEQLNAFILFLFLILFSTTYYWGRSAGKEIIIQGKNYLWVGVKYSLLELAIVLGYLIILNASNHATQRIWQSLLQVIIRITIPIIGIWLWSVWRIKLKASPKDLHQS